MSLQRRSMSNEDARFEVCPREAFCFICFCLDFEKRWIALPLTLKKKWRGTIPHCWLIGFDCYGRVMVITPLQLHCMVNGGRCTLPAQWTTQHNKMKRLVKYIQQMYDVSSVLSFLWNKKHLFNIVWFHCYQAEMNTNYYSDWLCSSTLSAVIHCVCELTRDVFFTGSFPTAVPRLSHHLHWPGSLPQSGPHCAIGKYFNAIWCRGG